MSDTEKHLRTAVLLMLFFFLADIGTDALKAFGYVTAKIGNGMAHDAFLMFFGIAAGILRGLMPGGNDGPGQK